MHSMLPKWPHIPTVSFTCWSGATREFTSSKLQCRPYLVISWIVTDVLSKRLQLTYTSLSHLTHSKDTYRGLVGSETSSNARSRSSRFFCLSANTWKECLYCGYEEKCAAKTKRHTNSKGLFCSTFSPLCHPSGILRELSSLTLPTIQQTVRRWLRGKWNQIHSAKASVIQPMMINEMHK